MSAKIPTLSLSGWLAAPEVKMNKLFEHFMASEYSQSNFHYGDVASLKYLIATTTDHTELRNNIINALRKLYLNHFDTAEVAVDVGDVNERGLTPIVVSISVTENGNTYTLRKAVEGKLGSAVNFYNALDDFYRMY